jgi:hypothetical protein
VILSSIVKIFNNTILPIAIFDLASVTGKISHRIDVNECYHVPMDLLYTNSNSSIFIGVDEYEIGIPRSDFLFIFFHRNDHTDSTGNFIVFDWVTNTTLEHKLQLKNGKTIHLIVYLFFRNLFSIYSI